MTKKRVAILSVAAAIMFTLDIALYAIGVIA